MHTSTRLFPLGVALLALAGASPARAADTATVERGRYLATAGDCVACHTAPGGQPMAGGLGIASPLGAIYATNVTPSRTHGIGQYTLEQFSDALRHGRRAGGGYLYPAMPYTAYAKLTDADMAALYAYFMQGVAPVDQATPATALPFPFNIRLSMAVWNALFHDASPYKPEPAQSVEWNRGAYLAQGLAHCGTCHTPRTLWMAEDKKRPLAGAELGGWYAPNITSDKAGGIGAWTLDELVAYMGGKPVPGKGPASGPMAEAVDHSLKHLSAEDLRAIAVYVKSVPGVSDGVPAPTAAVQGRAVDNLDTVRGVPLPQRLDDMSGAQLYDAYCASCHQAQGQGSDGAGLPALFHNTTLALASTNNLVQVLLHGVHRVGADSVMPGFAHELSDTQISTLSNYLLTHYGRPGAQVSRQQVATLRDPMKAAEDPHLLSLARTGMALALLVLLLAGALWGWRRRQRRR